MIKVHTINEIPEQRHNPFIGLLYEASLAPHIIMAWRYKDTVNKIVKDNIYPSVGGALIGWFYMDEIMPDRDEYRRLVSISAENNYYKDLEL